MTRYKDAMGKRFGRLIAIKRLESSGDGRARWLCKCDCGKETIVIYSALSTGNTISCGCALEEALTKHGKSKSKFYKVWQSMKTRCDNPNSNRFSYYGAKGVGYCIRWSIFENFYEDMHNDYKEGLTLDRIDGSKDYFKDNCHWVDYSAQNNNKSDNIKLLYHNKEYSPKEASIAFSISTTTIYNRRKKGWSDIRIIETPINQKNINKKYTFS
jgi:hypothetical protein